MPSRHYLPATAIKSNAVNEIYPPLVPRASRTTNSAVGFDFGTLVRITRMAFQQRLRMAIAVVATILAALAQLVIPTLIGDAVDQTQSLLAGTDVQAARDALFITAVWLLAASVARGALTMTQNYQGEAVGHRLAHEVRLAYYTKLQHLSFMS